MHLFTQWLFWLREQRYGVAVRGIRSVLSGPNCAKCLRMHSLACIVSVLFRVHVSLWSWLTTCARVIQYTGWYVAYVFLAIHMALVAVNEIIKAIFPRLQIKQMMMHRVQLFLIYPAEMVRLQENRGDSCY